MKTLDVSSGLIFSACSQDFYKITMKAAVFRHFPEVEAGFKFICRTEGVDLRGMRNDIVSEVCKCEQLSYSPSEIRYLGKFPYLSKGYLNFLKTQRWSADNVVVNRSDSSTNGGLEIRVNGPWLYTIDWEIWLLKIISELYTQRMVADNPDHFLDEGTKRLTDKLTYLREAAPGLRFVDMGARRAASSQWHYEVLRHIKETYPECLAGTSNVYLADLLNLPCFGTHAHEWDSAHLAFYHPADAKRMAMQHWLEAFGGDAGTCLSDTFTTKVFLRSFNKMYANAFTGVRHDSGPWRPWAQKVLDHYRSLGIDPKTKTLVFSDGLDFPGMVEIYKELKDICRVGFGIGTNLCNDIGFKPLNIVVKMVSCNGRPVLKISDVPTKATYEDRFFAQYVYSALGLGDTF